MMVRIFSAGVNPTPIAPIPPPAQTPRARSAVPPAKAMPALAKGWRQPKRSVIRVEMLPILSDLPQTARVTDRFDGNRAEAAPPCTRQPVSAGKGVLATRPSRPRPFALLKREPYKLPSRRPSQVV